MQYKCNQCGYYVTTSDYEVQYCSVCHSNQIQMIREEVENI